MQLNIGEFEYCWDRCAFHLYAIRMGILLSRACFKLIFVKRTRVQIKESKKDRF